MSVDIWPDAPPPGTPASAGKLAWSLAFDVRHIESLAYLADHGREIRGTQREADDLAAAVAGLRELADRWTEVAQRVHVTGKRREPGDEDGELADDAGS